MAARAHLRNKPPRAEKSHRNSVMHDSESTPVELHHQLVVSGSSTSNNPTVLLLHGRGDSAAGIAPLAFELNRDDLLVIAAEAPIPMGDFFGTGYEWYPMHEIGQPEQPGMRNSLAMLTRLLTTIDDLYPVDPERIVLLGFSQGAVMALAIQAVHPKSFAGVIALSGYFPIECSNETHDLPDCPIFIGHGNVDHIIPIEAGRESRDLLHSLGAAVTYREYSMGHQVSADEMADVRDWLSTVLVPQPKN